MEWVMVSLPRPDLRGALREPKVFWARITQRTETCTGRGDQAVMGGGQALLALM